MVISKAESQKNYYQRQIAKNRNEFLKKRKKLNNVIIVKLLKMK